MSSSKSAKKANILAFIKKANILAFSEKSQHIGLFQIKSQKPDFKSKYWPFSTVLLIKLYYVEENISLFDSVFALTVNRNDNSHIRMIKC